MGKHKVRRQLRKQLRKRRRSLWRRIKARVAKVFESKVVSNAKAHWVKGENLAPRIQPTRWRHYVARDDLEIYAVVLGGLEFQIEMLPESGDDLRKAAYDYAAERWGPFVDSLPIVEISAISDAARVVLPEPIHG